MALVKRADPGDVDQRRLAGVQVRKLAFFAFNRHNRLGVGGDGDFFFLTLLCPS